jgi:hypothetical protein
MRVDLRSTASLMSFTPARHRFGTLGPLPMHQPKTTLEMRLWIAQLIYAESSQYFPEVG